MLAGELHEFRHLAAQFTLCGCSDHADAASRAHLDQPFIANDTQGAQHGVRVYAHDSGEVPCGWNAVAWGRVTFCDGAAYLGRDLIVQKGRVASVEVDIQHCAIYISTL